MKLLIEIGLEELPAAPFLNEFKNMPGKWHLILAEFGLSSKVSIKFTPRRIVIQDDLDEFQPDNIQKMVGAPKQIAIKDGEFTNAAISFAKKCEISLDELEFKNIDGKEVLYFERTIKGAKTRELLGEILTKFIASLNFGKSMRWGKGEFDFIRPVRSAFCLFGSIAVDFEILGVKSSLGFFPHRNFGYDLVPFSTQEEYFEKLELFGVILDQEKRRERILSGFKEIEKSGLKIEIDSDLLDEVVAITEYPTPLLGKFESEFLSVPSEVIITSMKENQRYFPVYENGKLSNHFVVVSNAISDDNSLIINGNERVLRARLSDAKFFWDSDLSLEFSPEKLKNITYLKELGSLFDKTLRELEVAKVLAEIYQNELKNEIGENYKNELKDAIMLSKADLTTNMVYEFTDLQGIMGSYYAKHNGYSKAVSSAIKEQYLPKGDELPSGAFSSIVAMAVKFDTLMGLFSINKLPSGNKDPYALRRAASGIIKIALNLDINFEISAIIDKIKSNYAAFDTQILLEFFNDRLFANYEVNPSIIKACLSSNLKDLKTLNLAIKALDEIANDSDFRQNFSTFKRLANIIKDSNFTEVKKELFQKDAERVLFEKFSAIKFNLSDIKGYLKSLFGLKGEIDNFFDEVMINAEDKAIRDNRLALVGSIYKAFLQVADIKEISVNLE